MIDVNFIGLGAAKAGTTSLRHYLFAHPEVFIVRAEPRFFASENANLDPSHPSHHQTVTNIESYRKLFESVTTEKAIGEISPAYMHSPDAPERIKHYVPNAKLFAILRNPTDRAFAHYLQMVKSGAEPIQDFSEALNASKEYKANGWIRKRYYLDFGFYHQQLSRYYELFDKENIKIFLLEDLKSNPTQLASDLYRYLGVDDTFIPDLDVNYNPGGIPKSRVIQNILKGPGKFKSLIANILPTKTYQSLVKLRLHMQNMNLKKISFPQEMRPQLIDIYREDILNLQDLIGRDLSAWLEK